MRGRYVRMYVQTYKRTNGRVFIKQKNIFVVFVKITWKTRDNIKGYTIPEQNIVLWTKWKNNEYRTLQYIYTGFLMNRDRLISYRERSLFVQRPLFCSESTTFQSKRRTSKSCSLISSEWIGKKAKTRCRTRKVVLLYNLQ